MFVGQPAQAGRGEPKSGVHYLLPYAVLETAPVAPKTGSAKVGGRMAGNGPILVTNAAGQLGAVGRTVTGLLLERGLPVRAIP